MATPHNTLEVLLTERDVAQLLRVSVATIRRRRLFRQAPEWVKIGASVRYRPAAVRSLINDGKQKVAKGEILPGNTRQDCVIGSDKRDEGR